MVERSGRERAPLVWFVVGAVAGGALTGAFLGLLGLAVPEPPVPVRLVVLGVVAALLLVHDAGWRRWPLPQNARQVRQTVLREQTAVGAVMFGFELGTGARTFMTGAAPYLATAAVALASGWWGGLAVGVGFGLGRGLLPWDRELAGDRPGWDAVMRARAARVHPVLSLLLSTAVALLLLVR